MNCEPPTTRPSFPSLYNPLLDSLDSCDSDPGAVHLYHSSDIFRFTLYWTLIVYVPVFGLPGFWALFVHILPSKRTTSRFTKVSQKLRWRPRQSDDVPYTALQDLQSPSPVAGFNNQTNAAKSPVPAIRFNSPMIPPTPTITATTTHQPQLHTNLFPRPMNQRKSPIKGGVLLAVLMPIVFLLYGAVLALIGSLVLGYLLAALRTTAQVRISSWLPFLLAILQLHTVALGMFSNTLNFI